MATVNVRGTALFDICLPRPWVRPEPCGTGQDHGTGRDLSFSRPTYERRSEGMRIENPELHVIPGSRNVRLVWVSDEVCRSAEIARVGDVPKIVSYTVACERGIP